MRLTCTIPPREQAHGMVARLPHCLPLPSHTLLHACRHGNLNWSGGGMPVWPCDTPERKLLEYLYVGRQRGACLGTAHIT